MGATNKISWSQRTNQGTAHVAPAGRHIATQATRPIQKQAKQVVASPASQHNKMTRHEKPQKKEKPRHTPSSKRKNKNSAKTKEVTMDQVNKDNPFGGQKMSKEFEKWCKEQLKK